MIHIGCSGWNYDGWKGAFYPDDVSSSKMLHEYAKHFKTVEVNGTFYSLPKPQTVKKWAQMVSNDFVFSVKASQYITHMKKLKEPKEPLSNLYQVLEPFGDKLGPVLFQLPPSWNVNHKRLKDFLGHLSKDYRYTFEFRDKSWLCNEVYEALRQKNIALCIYDYKEYQSPAELTADFVYVRLHGPQQQAYKGSYKDNVLDERANDLWDWQQSDKEVFCYFDNDEKAHAPKDAERLKERVA